MTPLRLLVPAALLALAACSTTSPPPPAAPGAPGAAGLPPTVANPDTRPGAPRPGAPAPSPLSGEQRFLEGWFGGTPVVIAMQSNGTLGVDVPLLNAFNAGLAEPKPALAAVLDRVAESLRRQPQARVTVAAPSDGGPNVALAQARAQRVRSHLAGKQVAATRVVLLPGAATTNFVQLRIEMVAAPIGRLDDGALPVPAGGVRPTSTARPAASAPR